MTAVGPNGAAIFNFHGPYRLAVAADATVFLHLTDSLGVDISLTQYTSFVGSGRRFRNEALTTAPLFDVAAAFTTTGADGRITLTIDGSKVGQDTPLRGHYDLFGIDVVAGTHTLLVTGRWECVGGTVDAAAPVPA